MSKHKQICVYMYFKLCIGYKNYENWLAVDKVIAKITRLTFWPTLYMCIFVDFAVFNTVAIKENGRGVVDVDVDGVHTNIVMVKVVKSGLTPAEFCSRLAQVEFV